MSQSNLTAGFVDLATFDELEKYMYGGDQAVSYFVRKVRKSTWFTVVPVVLSKSAGSAQFGNQWGVNISRAGDYLLRTFLRVTIPSVSINQAGNRFGANGRLRWTRNLMHALIRECAITFNDLVEMRFDNFYLDFWSQFAMPSGKKNGYQNMIGNIEDLTNPLGISSSGGLVLPQATLNVPLPICHARDTGVGLPTAALPYNDMRLNFSFRDWTELLILDNVYVPAAGATPASGGVSCAASITDVIAAPVLSQVDVWAEYGIVSNNERKQMGQAPRDILIEQVQTVPTVAFNATSVSQADIRLSHAVKWFSFSARNTTNPAEHANYTCASPVPQVNGVNFSADLASDPISTVTLLYENTQRLSGMGADYFSLVNPWYNAVSIPGETGYHMYSYSLDIMSVNPMGSTNFGKLTNVTISVTPSPDAQTAATTGGTLTAPNAAFVLKGAGIQQQFQMVLVAINSNIVRVSGGALGNFICFIMCVLLQNIALIVRSNQNVLCQSVLTI